LRSDIASRDAVAICFDIHIVFISKNDLRGIRYHFCSVLTHRSRKQSVQAVLQYVLNHSLALPSDRSLVRHPLNRMVVSTFFSRTFVILSLVKEQGWLGVQGVCGGAVGVLTTCWNDAHSTPNTYNLSRV
jgi:hypothetical protein